MSQQPAKGSLFPTIGKVAEETEKISEDQDALNVNTTEDDRAVQEIESLCMKCGEEGSTRLLLTSIPFFQEIIVMSFHCPHCGEKNNEIQSAGIIRAEGTLYNVKITDRRDLNRQIVRSATCEVTFPDFELTLPPTNKGQLTTVEGLVRDVIADLSMDQPIRRIQAPEAYTKIQALLERLIACVGDEPNTEDASAGSTETKKNVPITPFILTLEDPAGNSFVEFIDGMSDPKWTMKTYPRTLDQNIALGLISAEDAAARKEEMKSALVDEAVNVPVSDDEIFVFPGICSSCAKQIHTYMKKVNIPYFKDVLIMSTNCEHCGYRDNEVKSGAAISPQGKKIILKVEDADDLSRDILKSETAGLSIPEIDLVLDNGTLGGRFTTVEGILTQIHEELSGKVAGDQGGEGGDSAVADEKSKMKTFLDNLLKCKNAEMPFTLILDDPLANSYLQNLYAPDPDPNMTIEFYDRSWEQNEELGLNDIKVENYAADDGEEKEEKEKEKEKEESETPASST